ncbi:uncharacterized protein N7506_012363 [Penicillium brevicompactum]|uniref:uncharacterized protein n=1 Tax=Penicillium brevicompactum TaxID=5074 RepID=UPI002542643D|nr:uncharacterized protein N7506_012363 [Penicillium brevicompactum]KAJ5319659.1 hypothetical protein N7506_012363 [Penicillium brevicompactum]
MPIHISAPPSPPAPTGEWSPALAAAAAPRARARRHPYLFARVAAPRFPHRRPSPKSPSIATSQHPPRPPTGDLAPPAPQGFPGPHPRARVAILGSNALGETAEGYTVGQMYEEGNPWGQGQRRRGSPCQRLPAANILDPPGSLSSYIISTE